MGKVVIAGGGWAGCSAALIAAHQGADVILLEKTDLLLGAGNVGGIMNNNGRLTAAEENRALGGGDFFDLADRYSFHKNLDFPGHRHASIYDAERVEVAIGALLKEVGVDVRRESRAVNVKMTGERIEALEVISSGAKYFVEGDAFVEATGSSGPMGNCMAYGNGCAMCIQRCPAFGPRVSLTRRAGKEDFTGKRRSGTLGGIPGAFSGSCKIKRSSLSAEVQDRLRENGCLVIPLPEHLVRKSKLTEKVCQQYALEAFSENLVILDGGDAKVMTPYLPLEELRQLKGFEEARYADPLGGSFGNSLRYMDVGQRESDLRAVGIKNLYLAGEKAGFFVGHTEAITTGNLAGYNSGRLAAGKESFVLPRSLAVGELLARGQELLEEEDGLFHRLTFAGGEFLLMMEEKKLYCTVREEIQRNVEAEGLRNIYKNS